MTGNFSDEQRGPIVDVRSGMRVLDAGGAEIGTVERVKMGDPEAVTGRGQDMDAGGGLVADAVMALGGGPEPDLPPDSAARLTRIGYLKVDGKGLFARDFYVPADQVARVRDDVVHLDVHRDQLPDES